MLIELWERLRKYDKWTAAQAIIESSDVSKTPIANRAGQIVDYRYGAGDVITWTDPSGEKHYADFDVDENSPLFQYVGGESVPIRYDPTNPDRFYYRDLLKSQVHSAIRTALILLALLAIFIGWLIAAAGDHTSRR